MIPLLLLLAPAAQAQNDVVLTGMSSSPLQLSWIEVRLHEDGTLSTSQGITATYEMLPGPPRTIDYSTGRATGQLTETSPNQWEEARSRLSNDRGDVALRQQNNHLLRHYDAACAAAPLFVYAPAPGEDGHWSAGRLTPPAGGMWVESVTYYLYTGGVFGCEPLDHRVQLFIGDAALAPPATPTVLHEAFVVGATLGIGDTSNTIELPAPIFVADTESLFVSMEQIRTAGGEVTCPADCVAGGFLGDHSYWSNSATTPYSWQDLNSWGIEEMMVEAHGVFAAP